MTIQGVLTQGTGHDNIRVVLTVRALGMTIYRVF